MAGYIKDGTFIDNESLELMYLYISDFRIFKNVGINLNAKYKFDMRETDPIPTIKIDSNENYTGLLDEYNINLKVICGINGTGKTTIINILKGYYSEFNNNFYILFIDKDNNFICSNKVILEFNGLTISLIKDAIMIDSLLNTSCVSVPHMKIDDFIIEKRIIDFYVEHPELYNIGKENIFNKFEIDFWNIDEDIDIISNITRKELFYNFNTFEIKKLFIDNPLFYIFIHISQDSSFESLYESDILNKDFESTDELLNYFLENIFSKTSMNTYKKLQNELKEFLYIMTNGESSLKKQENRSYDMIQYKIIKNKFDELRNKILIYFRNIFKEAHIELNYISSIIFFNPFLTSNKLDRNRYFGDLSAGEQIVIKNKYYLVHSMSQKVGVWFDIDEPDKFLHPEWKRQFLMEYLKTISFTREYISKHHTNQEIIEFYKNKTYSILLTTHSPYILSDLNKDYIIFLDKDDNNNTIVRDDIKNTFAGNIGEMYYNNFFMKETIGEFAKGKIKKILETLKKPMTLDEKKRIEKIIYSIGDDLLRNLLIEKLDEVKII